MPPDSGAAQAVLLVTKAALTPISASGTYTTKFMPDSLNVLHKSWCFAKQSSGPQSHFPHLVFRVVVRAQLRSDPTRLVHNLLLIRS